MKGSDLSEVRVSVESVSKEFLRTGGSLVKALDDISLSVMSNEIMVLLGPSGCGKSTLLRAIAGLEHPDSGAIRIGEQMVFDATVGIVTPADRRDVNMMFQSYALWPHMTLEANVAYPLRVRGVRRGPARAQANTYLELVGLTGLGKQYAGSVSGGQAQRAALARTLIAEPAVVLFDEPLSNVDAKVRSRLRSELLRIHKELGFSAVYVTHDQIEAMGVATRIAIMRDGRILQADSPGAIYERPTTRYAGEFIGEANFLEGRISSVKDTSCIVTTDIGDLAVGVSNFEHPPTSADHGAELTLMVRPEYIRLERDSATKKRPGSSTFTGVVETSLYAGSRTEYACDVNGVPLQVWEMAAPTQIAEGTAVSLDISPEVIRVIGSETHA